ncbi:hypothetical protein [Bifidobacterium leontopitheci]|uniref:Toxin n=1 Tax=Bifidobacterium leontopitheci TaxID=2650774 RepID=A0A6I1GDH6_9BIFI|nr:hypothetical protein [Bifidobacterium leontopitheci]KAB7789684.1 hypothetical protein F7D09_1818 [Bifidobacterium leontopitheci]
MENVIVHPRVHERHPDISDEDVLKAWHNVLLSAPRDNGTGSWVSIGMDDNGRLLEMVSVHNDAGQWLIYHAMTPPTKKTMKELGATRRTS